ncbi:Inner membrane protein YohD [uncultured bacterium]|nr:Inner membrane protein YohD [uncultured bacterium]
MNEINHLIHTYGDWIYVIAFFWAALEGETFVIFAGLAAQRGYLNVFELIAAVGLGSLLGDQICFWLGRCYGHRLLHHFPKIETGVDQAILWLERHAVGFILSYRFMYGIRNVSSVAIGMSHLTWQKFAFWNAVAAFIWAVAFSNIGYSFGHFVEKIPHGEDVLVSSIHQIMLSVVGLFLLIIGFRIISTRLHKRHLLRLHKLHLDSSSDKKD